MPYAIIKDGEAVSLFEVAQEFVPEATEIAEDDPMVVKHRAGETKGQLIDYAKMKARAIGDASAGITLREVIDQINAGDITKRASIDAADWPKPYWEV